ncbi:MAG: metallophosphoesterase [Desulfobacteraceae bacterium]|nr:metallophosphoesterase [Desulfobacteraceae bacterium]
MGVFVFSDIHGNWEAYNRVMSYVDAKNRFNKLNNKEENHVVCIGDLVDRGANSAKIVNDYADRMKKNKKFHFIFGNHEISLFKAITFGEEDPLWVRRKKNPFGGWTVCRELAQKGKPGTKKFLDSFFYLMDHGVGRIYVRVKHMYVISHAGPSSEKHRNKRNEMKQAAKQLIGRQSVETQKEFHSGDREVLRNLIRAKTIPHFESRIKSITERKNKFKKHRKRSNLYGGQLHLDNENRKYHVHGHTVQQKTYICQRWNEYAYDNYKELEDFCLPVDAGLAFAGISTTDIANPKHTYVFEKVACGYISSDPEEPYPHSIEFLDGITEKTEQNPISVNNSYNNNDAKHPDVAIFFKRAEEYFDGKRRKDYYFSLILDKQISWSERYFKDFHKNNYKTLNNLRVLSPIVKTGSCGNNSLVNYIKKRRKEGFHSGLWVREAYNRETKLRCAIWVYCYLNGIIDNEDLRGPDIQEFYDTINDKSITNKRCQLYTAIKGVKADEERGIKGGEQFLEELRAFSP